MSLFCSVIQSRTPRGSYLPVFLGSSDWESISASSVTTWWLRECPWIGICRMFSRAWTGVMGLGTNATELKCPYHVILSPWALTLITWSRWCLPAPRPLQVLVSSFYTGVFASESLRAIHSEGDGINLYSKSGECIYTYYLEMFYVRCAASRPFVYLVIYWSQYELISIYFLLWVVIQYYCYVFCGSDCSCFSHWSSASWLLCPVDTPPSFFAWFSLCLWAIS